MASAAASVPAKGAIYHQHPVIPGGWADAKLHDLPKDTRPLRAVKLGELHGWFEPKRFTPIQLIYAFNRFKYQWNGAHQTSTGSYAARRFLPFVLPYFLYQQINIARGGHADMYKQCKYHW